MKVIVIGGGASGMVAAIVAAKNGHDVTLLEQRDHLGKKLLATGNGRCNLTNMFLKSKPWEHYLFEDEYEDKIINIFNKFGYEDTILFFKNLGLMVTNENELVYPLSKQAVSVLEILEYALRDNKVIVKTDEYVTKIIKDKDIFSINTSNNLYKADKVICSFGSKAQPKLGGNDKGYWILENMGHAKNDIYPGLVQLTSNEKFLDKLNGVRVDAKLSLLDDNLLIYEESGQLQFTKYGLSGIVAMNISNYLPRCKKQAEVKIDMLASMNKDDLFNLLMDRKEAFKDRKISEFLVGITIDKVNEVIIDILKLNANEKISSLTKSSIMKITECIKELSLLITGTKTFEEAQITIGGISMKNVNSNMESTIVKGLYITGETLDVHGGCGGFNLQWAFTTGAIAGELIDEN